MSQEIKKATINAVVEHNRLIQKFPYGETNQEHCIHGIKLRWSCEGCEDELEEKEQNISQGKFNKEFFLKIIREWKSSWMNQRQNSEYDYENYFKRAFGVDANMMHSLANRLEEAMK